MDCKFIGWFIMVFTKDQSDAWPYVEFLDYGVKVKFFPCQHDAVVFAENSLKLEKYIEQWEKDVGSPSNVITE